MPQAPILPAGSRIRGMRAGKKTGTAIILEMLEAHGGWMTTRDIKAECHKVGVNSPESALYRLGKLESIERGDGVIWLKGRKPPNHVESLNRTSLR